MVPTQSFKYHIVNVKSGTVLDLSGTNQTTISGWKNNGGDNQEWYTEEEDAEIGLFAIKNVKYGKFAYFTGAVRQGAPAVGVEEKRLWRIQEDGPAQYRISILGSPFVLELSKDGDRKNGTPVVLAFQRPVDEQKWKFVAV